MSRRVFAGLIVALGAGSVLLLAGAAQPGAVAVSLLSVVPGTPSGDGAWCVGTERVRLTANAVDVASQTELTEGMIVWQICDSPSRGGFPKEACDTGVGSARWRGVVLSDLSFDSSPSIGTSPIVPVLGFRMQYRPASGSGLKSATSASFNLDTTCSP
jgi:hypothetical protein